MKALSLRALALILAIMILSSLLTSCAEKSGDDETTTIEETNSVTTEETGDGDETSNPETTPAASEADSTESQADNTTVETSTEGAKTPSTKEEIMKYYADAVGEVKTSAKSVVKTYGNTINYGDILEIGNNQTIANFAKSLMNSFMKEETAREEHNDPADIADAFPPKKSPTCSLTASMVETATCVDMGTYYEIEMHLNSSESNPDVNPAPGGGIVGTAFNILELHQITDPLGSMVKFEGLKLSYFDAHLKCHIEKDTGNMTYLETYVPSVLSFEKVTALLIPISNVKLGLEFQDKWEINW